jgi:ferredoxin
LIRVVANQDTCEGFGVCVLAAEEVFDLDDGGTVVVKAELVDDALLEKVRRAAYDCPTDSISFEAVESA